MAHFTIPVTRENNGIMTAQLQRDSFPRTIGLLFREQLDKYRIVFLEQWGKYRMSA